MILKNISCIFAGLLITSALTACTIIRESHELPEGIKWSVAKIRAEEKKSAAKAATVEYQKITTENKELRKQQQRVNEYRLSRKLVGAFLKGDGRTFTALLPAKLRQEFDHKKFEVTRKAVISSMGEPVSFRYVTALEMTSVTPHIWAIRFSRISRDEKEEYTSEMLFRVITGYLDGKPYIIGFNFF